MYNVKEQTHARVECQISVWNNYDKECISKTIVYRCVSFLGHLWITGYFCWDVTTVGKEEILTEFFNFQVKWNKMKTPPQKYKHGDGKRLSFPPGIVYMVDTI